MPPPFHEACARRLAVLVCASVLTLAVLPAALAQPAEKPPVADEGPRFEIRRFVFEGARLVPQAQLEEATRAFTGQSRSFGDVQRALETIERLYSSAGYSAVQVILPEQELERGEVRFSVIEAKLGRVLIEGNKFFDDASIRASVPALAPGRSPNINEVARSLRVANESPARQTTVLLRSGQEEATVDAVVRVADEHPLRASVTMDTTGTDATGRLRVGFGVQHANMFGLDHVFTGQLVTSPHDPLQPNSIKLRPSRNVFVVGAGYRIPLYRLGDSIDITYGYSNVNAGTVAGLFNIAGAGTIFGVRYTRNLDRIGDYDHRLLASLDFRGYANRVTPAGGGAQLVPDISVRPFSLTYNGILRGRDRETNFSFGLSNNWRGVRDGKPEDFQRTRSNGLGESARAGYTIWRWSFSHNQALPADFQMRLAMNGQATRDMLIPGEQFGVGGMDSVRGFLEREVTNDNGYRGTVELYTPDWGFRLGSNVRARSLLFFDWGGVRRMKPGPAEIHSQHIGAWGFGIRVAQGASMSLRVDYAIVTDQGGFQRQGDGRLHASFSYVF